MKFSQLFGQLRSQPSEREGLVNFWSTLVNYDSNNDVISRPLVVDQISDNSQPTVVLTSPPVGGSQQVNFSIFT
jgi:hypothetical protein